MHTRGAFRQRLVIQQDENASLERRAPNAGSKGDWCTQGPRLSQSSDARTNIARTQGERTTQRNEPVLSIRQSQALLSAAPLTHICSPSSLFVRVQLLLLCFCVCVSLCCFDTRLAFERHSTKSCRVRVRRTEQEVFTQKRKGAGAR